MAKNDKATAAKIEEKTDDTEQLDPNAIVELTVVSRENAGKAPSTRWGKVSFDENGEGKVKLPLKDVHLLNQLRWVTAEDQEKYLGISQQAAAQATNEQASDLQARLDATTAANVRMAQKNAELEAQIDAMKANFRKELDAYKGQIDDEMKSVHAQLDKTQAALDEHTVNQQALMKENEDLKAQLAAATAPKGK